MADDYSTPTRSPSVTTPRPAKPPFGYYGAKLRIAPQIIRALPPHHAWVEGFCGSAAITLAKEPVQIEVINDYDKQVVNLFEQLRTNAEALCRAVELTPYARSEFEDARTMTWVDDPLESARRFLVATMMTVNATIGEPSRCGFSFSTSYARGGREARVNRWYKLPDRLAQVVERLRGVRVEHRDACEIVDMFSDRPATLLYLDPPYFTERHHKYVIEANEREFHADLLRRCKRAACMVLISAYENELYDEMLNADDGWSRCTIDTHTRDTTGRDYVRTEVLWMNAWFSKAARDKRVPIRLKKAESAANKINPPRKWARIRRRQAGGQGEGNEEQ
jgi:DNA adenine methylase